MGWFMDAIAALTGRRRRRAPEIVLPPVPTGPELLTAIDGIPPQISGRVPAMVQARVDRIVATVRDTIPRLNQLGAGSRDAHAVMATVTSYLPEALGAYLRLPRSYADRRPVEGGKTSLMVLVDQLDLLSVTMDKIFDAVCREDAEALVVHGKFLAEKFGHSSSLDIGGPGAPGALGGGVPGGGVPGGGVPGGGLPGGGSQGGGPA